MLGRVRALESWKLLAGLFHSQKPRESLEMNAKAPRIVELWNQAQICLRHLVSYAELSAHTRDLGFHG